MTNTTVNVDMLPQNYFIWFDVAFPEIAAILAIRGRPCNMLDLSDSQFRTWLNFDLVVCLSLRQTVPEILCAMPTSNARHTRPDPTQQDTVPRRKNYFHWVITCRPDVTDVEVCFFCTQLNNGHPRCCSIM